MNTDLAAVSLVWLAVGVGSVVFRHRLSALQNQLLDRMQQTAGGRLGRAFRAQRRRNAAAVSPGAFLAFGLFLIAVAAFGLVAAVV